MPLAGSAVGVCCVMTLVKIGGSGSSTASDTSIDAELPICRCEQVTSGEIQQVAEMGCMGPNQGKAFTRCGMGPCMGRQCGNAVSQVMAHCHRKSVDEIGHYRIRPPVRPITVGQLSRISPG